MGFLVAVLTILTLWVVSNLLKPDENDRPQNQQNRGTLAEGYRPGRQENKFTQVPPQRPSPFRLPNIETRASLARKNRELQALHGQQLKSLRESLRSHTPQEDPTQLLFKTTKRVPVRPALHEGKNEIETERLRREANERIFQENNKYRERGTFDLHGLGVKEAKEYTEREIVNARKRGDAEIRLIVGRGIHSQNGRAIIRPAIEALVRKRKLSSERDSLNDGILIVQVWSGKRRAQ